MISVLVTCSDGRPQCDSASSQWLKHGMHSAHCSVSLGFTGHLLRRKLGAPPLTRRHIARASETMNGQGAPTCDQRFGMSAASFVDMLLIAAELL